MSNLIIFGNHVLSSRGRATVVGNARVRAPGSVVWRTTATAGNSSISMPSPPRRRLRASPLVCSSSSTPFREIQTDTGSVGLELGGWWRLRQAGGHGWSSFHERRTSWSERARDVFSPSVILRAYRD